MEFPDFSQVLPGFPDSYEPCKNYRYIYIMKKLIGWFHHLLFSFKIKFMKPLEPTRFYHNVQPSKNKFTDDI